MMKVINTSWLERLVLFLSSAGFIRRIFEQPKAVALFATSVLVISAVMLISVSVAPTPEAEMADCAGEVMK